jgi:hypothetical protein
MYNQLAYHANHARIDDLKRQAAEHRRAKEATRTWAFSRSKSSVSETSRSDANLTTAVAEVA